jgi:hypothetical protein
MRVDVQLSGFRADDEEPDQEEEHRRDDGDQQHGSEESDNRADNAAWSEAVYEGSTHDQ